MMILNPYRYRTNNDPFFANVVSLMHMNGANGSTTITDVIGKTWSCVGNAKLSTTSPKFGTASLILDGSGDWIQTADSADWDFGSGQFTVECFIRATAATSNAGFVSQWGAAGVDGNWALYLDTGILYWRFYDSGNNLRDTSVAFNPTVGTWYHIAATRDASGTVRLFRDGTVIASAANNFAFRDASTQGVQVGAVGGFSPTFDFNGRIDEVRITKGVCRYTANFTAPTAEFPDF